MDAKNKYLFNLQQSSKKKKFKVTYIMDGPIYWQGEIEAESKEEAENLFWEMDYDENAFDVYRNKQQITDMEITEVQND